VNQLTLMFPSVRARFVLNVTFNIINHYSSITYVMFGAAFRFQMVTYYATKNVALWMEWTNTGIPMCHRSLNISIIDR
jgi:hypothetical protein